MGKIKSHKPGTSGVRGVYKTGRDNKPWGAKVTVDGKAIYLGHYATLEEAERVAKDGRKAWLWDEHFDPRSLAYDLLAKAEPDKGRRALARANAMLAAAKTLGVTPYTLPEGWDLA
jgi:hypothetical protein